MEEASEPRGEGDGRFDDGGGGGCYNVQLYSFVKIRIFDLDFGLQRRIVDPSQVELIGKESILGLETTTNR